METVNQCEVCDKKFDSPFQLIEHNMKLCKARKCGDCGGTFKRHRDLQHHLKNRKDIKCTHCEKRFCSNDHFQQHLRSMKEGNEGESLDLDQRIQPPTGYESDEGFKNILQEKDNEIGDGGTVSKNYTLVNRKIDPSFTYAELC